jgi:hypothetical protein
VEYARLLYPSQEEAMASDLERRVAKLEAVEDIRRLKARYAADCDDGYDPSRLAALFTADAIWDAGPMFGRHVGSEEIYRFFDGVSRTLTWASHLMIDPSIDVADSLVDATGTWYLLQPATMSHGGEQKAVWISGFYRDTYRKEDDTWRFAQVTLDVHYVSPHDEGWVRRPFLDG